MDFIWEERFAELQVFKKKNGHFIVPIKYPESPKLGTWVTVQRRRFKQGRLEAMYVSRLEYIGFIWDTLTIAWEERFTELQNFKNKHGHCNAPQTYPESPQLGRWIATQRKAFKQGSLETERIDRLEGIGFIWDTLTFVWEERFAELQDFKKKHGHCNVPYSYPDSPQLGIWVKTQRKTFKKGSLETERADRLEGIGFIWDTLSFAWEERFDELQDFKKKHGHCYVPQTYPESKQLGTWVGWQRKAFNQGSLEAEHVNRLEMLGFVWNPLEFVWKERFAELHDFKKKHGHCRVPHPYQKNPKLGTWVKRQRKAFKQGSLETEHVNKLKEIGFVWYNK